MDKHKQSLFTALILFTFLWTLPAYGLEIQGPPLNQAEKGWKNFGLLIRAEADIMLVSVRFPNQGLADIIQLRRDSDSALLASFPVPAGNRNAIVNINYPLNAKETYRLVATTPNNKYYGAPGTYKFPVAYPEMTVLGSYLGYPYYGLWCTFNDITVQLNNIEVAVDIKPGSAVNSINLKSKGVVPVAILTTEDFDALDVDADSVVLAGASPVRAQIEDVNDDGYNDILFHFRTRELTELSSGSTKAALTGATLDGTPISGEDTVNIVPAGK
jgi:hypothetical protein